MIAEVGLAQLPVRARNLNNYAAEAIGSATAVPAGFKPRSLRAAMRGRRNELLTLLDVLAEVVNDLDTLEVAVPRDTRAGTARSRGVLLVDVGKLEGEVLANVEGRLGHDG